MHKFLKSRSSGYSTNSRENGQNSSDEPHQQINEPTGSHVSVSVENPNGSTKNAFHPSIKATKKDSDCGVQLRLTTTDSESDRDSENLLANPCSDVTKAERRPSLNVGKVESNNAKRRVLPEKRLESARECRGLPINHDACTGNNCYFGNICTVIEQNERIIKMLETLIDRSDSCEHFETLYSRPEGFPLKTLQDFNAFEANPHQTNELKKYLTFVGGRTLREALYQFQKETMSDDLVMHFTWWGLTEGTRGFHSTRLAKVFFDVVNRSERTKPKDRSHFQNEISEVFRSAKQRVANRQHKVQPRHRQGLMRMLRAGADSVFHQSEDESSSV